MNTRQAWQQELLVKGKVAIVRQWLEEVGRKLLN